MLALVFFAVAICLGDRICRRFYPFLSVQHRLAAAFTVGMIVAGWITYLTALAFGHAALPLFWGNFCFFAIAIAVFSWPRWGHKIFNVRIRHITSPIAGAVRPRGSNGIDWLFIAAFFALACWMMFATLSSSGGKILIANNEYSDFGPNTAIIQSFGVGHNFPTEYPHFSGDRIRYHFLFYFLAGNLEFLGFDPAWGLNLLSIVSLVSMLVLVMMLGEVLFQSRVVGRVAAVLFFFFGSLSYIPFFRKEGSLSAALHNIYTRNEFLPSIFPYRGELWGVWTQVTYANQRHFAMSIAVLLLVLVFLVIRYREVLTRPALAPAPGHAKQAVPGANVRLANSWAGFIFCGVLLGLLPMWNSAVFVAAAGVLGLLFLLFPLRLQMLAVAAPAGLIALPQMLYLSTGAGRVKMPPLFHWGYTIEHPTVWNVLAYLGFSFGFKWLLLVIALIFANSLQRRFFVATLSLIGIAFFFQLTIEVLANQKFLHIWAILANLFVAYGLWRLWTLPGASVAVAGKFAASVLFLAIIPGGIIDLFPLHNGYWNAIAIRNDPLIEWLRKETKPRDIFLTDRFVTHPILMAGRRVFYGWPYYAWGAGYDATQRDRVYRELFENRDPAKVYEMLKENGIAYVAFDNAVRHGDFIKRPNEQIYSQYFPKVFDDKENHYNSLTIYKVPDKPPANLKSLPEVAPSMFEGGAGAANGQFNLPHGMAVDATGNIYICDTGNGRIEKFSAAGAFIGAIGSKGTGYGQFGDPNGIAVGRDGSIYVAESLNHRIQKLTPDGNFIAEWKGPDPQFYGPRKIAVGPDQSFYVVDQGRARIVRFDKDFKALATWGDKGKNNGQFDDPTSVTVDPGSNKVFVADPRNQRIQVFDTTGKFLASWPVTEWGKPYGFEDLAVDPIAKRLYASSANMDSIVTFDLDGKRLENLKPKSPNKLEGAASVVVVDRKLYVLNTGTADVVGIDLQ